jgi:hypothetical protein
VSALETKTPFLSTGTDGNNKPALFITGANVYIQDGTGSTDSTSGLGNLIVGYNALRDSNNARTGAHNLILGDKNNYTSYGGLVAGLGNTISDIYALVSGGQGNTASGSYASVSGGNANVASGFIASVSGGYKRSATGDYNWVAGAAFQDD